MRRPDPKNQYHSCCCAALLTSRPPACSPQPAHPFLLAAPPPPQVSAGVQQAGARGRERPRQSPGQGLKPGGAHDETLCVIPAAAPVIGSRPEAGGATNKKSAFQPVLAVKSRPGWGLLGVWGASEFEARQPAWWQAEGPSRRLAGESLSECCCRPALAALARSSRLVFAAAHKLCLASIRFFSLRATDICPSMTRYWLSTCA